MQRTALLDGLATQLIMIIDSWKHGSESERCRDAAGTPAAESVDNSATPFRLVSVSAGYSERRR